MADIQYTLTESQPQNISGFEQYSDSDINLIERYLINSLFDSQKHLSELHIYSISDELLESVSDYTNYKFLANAQSAGKEGASELTIDPIADSIDYGYPNGGIKLLYHFLNDLFTEDKTTAEFFINGISDDRTELRLLASDLDESIIQQVATTLHQQLTGQSYFEGFRLNFGNNDLLIATNISSISYNNQLAVVVKLYEPLPATYDLGSTLSMVEVVADSISYEITTQSTQRIVQAPTLKAPNFNIEIQDHAVVPSQYLNYNELFSYPVNNSNNQIYSAFNEKGIEISVDYTTYEDFVHFSSAQERLLNFKYKVDLLSSYSASLSSIASAPQTLAGVSGSTSYYNGLISGVVSNFDHYERFLYYQSGSNSWPKTNSTKPYINAQSTIPGTTTPNTAVTTWFSNQLNAAAYYDSINGNLLVNTIPTYLRDDPNNDNYLTYIHMVAQHFDNLWLYGKAVSDKYDADNRLDFGISRDLVAEALKNFGVQLYTSNRSVQDLFTTIIGQSYQSGSEQITNYITGSYTGSNASIQPASYDTYQKEIYKRIYHNLPLLLSSKGTERGLRALINCFGIPQDILQIKLYGGRNTGERPFYGDYRYFTSSLDKIRLDNTGSIVTGSTLSNYTSIVKRDDKYTDDLHPIEVGFSPTDNVDNYIISASKATASLASFNIDDYLGDPRNLTSDTYYTYNSAGVSTSTLSDLTNRIMSGSTAYNVQDYVKLIKFFDNTVFKMIKDFIPARAVADTGIIIKPHVLGRSKAKSLILSGSTPVYTGSIDTAFISAGDTNNFRSFYGLQKGVADTRYINNVQTPTGINLRYDHNSYEVNYNGEISGSVLAVSKRDLNSANPYKTSTYITHPYDVYFISTSNEVCLLNTKTTAPATVTDPSTQYSADTFFSFINANCVYSASQDNGATWVYPVTFPTSFPIQGLTFTPGVSQSITIRALNHNLPGTTCTKDINVHYAPCTMYLSTVGADITTTPRQMGSETKDLTSWIINPTSQILQYSASWTDTTGAVSASLPLTVSSTNIYRNAPAFRFDQPEGTTVTIKIVDKALRDSCTIIKQVLVTNCNLKRRRYYTTGTTPQTAESAKGFSVGLTYIQGWNNGGIVNANHNATYIETDGGVSYVDATGQYRIHQNYLGNGYITYNPLHLNDPYYATAKYRGIQAYFINTVSPSGYFDSVTVAQNALLRYNIYEMTNPNLSNTYSTGILNTDGYTLRAIAKGINPSQPQSTWSTPGCLSSDPTSVYYNAFLPITYENIDGLNYTNNVTVLSTTTITYKPIVLPLPSRSTYTPTYDVDQNIIDTTVTPADITTLPRAYVIECYRVDQPLCLKQVVVYTDTNTVIDASIQGPGTYPQFTTKQILAGWNYTPGGGNVITPSPGHPTVNPGYGPWIDTKIRTYSTTPGTYGTGDNIPPL